MGIVFRTSDSGTTFKPAVLDCTNNSGEQINSIDIEPDSTRVADIVFNPLSGARHVSWGKLQNKI
jgi:hypothetical protein